jgi:hypothetical protein
MQGVLQKIFIGFTVLLLALSFSVFGWMFLGLIVMAYVGSSEDTKLTLTTFFCSIYWFLVIAGLIIGAVT